MNLNKIFLIIVIFTALISCTKQKNHLTEEQQLDSIRKADSIAAAVEQQRLIDSVNMVTIEQQIIADSISNQVTN